MNSEAKPVVIRGAMITGLRFVNTPIIIQKLNSNENIYSRLLITKRSMGTSAFRGGINNIKWLNIH